jgi:hypothetical protein
MDTCDARSAHAAHAAHANYNRVIDDELYVCSEIAYDRYHACDYVVVRPYKKDRIERFLDFIIANIMILRGLCIIAYIFCKVTEKTLAIGEAGKD